MLARARRAGRGEPSRYVPRSPQSAARATSLSLPANDLVRSPLSAELVAHGAFRADVSGAGPTLYGLFHRRADASRAAGALKHLGRTWITVPVWYG